MLATQGYLNRSGTKSRLAKEDVAVTNSERGATSHRIWLSEFLPQLICLIGQIRDLTLCCLFFIPGGT